MWEGWDGMLGGETRLELCPDLVLDGQRQLLGQQLPAGGLDGGVKRGRGSF